MGGTLSAAGGAGGGSGGAVTGAVGTSPLAQAPSHTIHDNSAVTLIWLMA